VIAPFGDGTQFRGSRAGPLMYWFSTLTRDSRLRWYTAAVNSSAGSNIMGVVLKDDSIKPLPPFDLEPARCFEGVGLAVLRTDLVDRSEDVGFIMRSSPYGAVSHGHNDQNCFVLEAYGEALAVATGHYNRYSSPHHSGWTRQTKAKCGITHDGGRGQDRGWQARGKITDYLHGAAFDLLRGDATTAYGGRLDRVVREVVHVRPGVFIIRDDLADDEPHVYEYWLHALDEMKADGGAVLIQRPRASLAVHFLEPANPTYTQTDQFDPPVGWPPDRTFVNNWHLTAAQPSAKTSAAFLTALLPAKAGEEAKRPAVSKLAGVGCTGVELKWGDGRRALLGFADPGAAGPYEFAGIRTDAPVFAVSLAATGAPTGWLAKSATRLELGNRALHRSAVATSATVSLTAASARLDTVGAGGDLTFFKGPAKARAILRDGEEIEAQGDGDSAALSAEPGRDSVRVWFVEPPGPAGDFGLSVRFGEASGELRGVRNAEGDELVFGRLDLPPGAYSLGLPGDARVSGVGFADGVLWLNTPSSVSIRGRDLPRTLNVQRACETVELPAVKQASIPGSAISFEAEKNWTGDAGGVKVSGGGHENTSGNDNLWAWNKAGHTLAWILDVPAGGEYELWFVGASQCGILATLRVNGGQEASYRFCATGGGWGRKNADEWRAFRIPVRLVLNQGKNTISLTNRTGLGLNLDRLALSRE